MAGTWKMLGWIWEKLWRWEVVAIGSPAVYGAGITAMYADDYIVAAVLYFAAITWLTAKILAWEETKEHTQRRGISVIILVLAIFAFGGSLLWVKHRRYLHQAELHREPTPKQGTEQSQTALPETVESYVVREWGTLYPNRYHVLVDTSRITFSSNYRVMIVCRVNDSTIEAWDDSDIEKSSTFAIDGQVKEISLITSQRFMRKLFPTGNIRTYLAVVPDSVKPDQVLKISDIQKLGGKVWLVAGETVSLTGERTFPKNGR